MFSTASPHPLMSLIRAQGEPTLICEKYRAGILWQKQIWLQCPGQWAQGPQGDVGPSGIMKSVSDCLVRDIRTSVLFEVILYLWQRSSCSSWHNGADTDPADGLKTFYSPVQLSQINCLSSGISSMLLRLCWETANLLVMARIDLYWFVLSKLSSLGRVQVSPHATSSDTDPT